MAVTDKDIADLVARAADANAALMNGDAKGYFALISLAEDFTLMAPFGGPPTLGFDMSSDRVAALGRFFRAGRTALELVRAYATDDMAVLVVIERQTVEVGGLPDQDWSLRVTLVFRRDGPEWRLVHRHADPLVKGISLEQAAAIARG
jgi:ketosteroid isomerase-like protein